MVISLSKEIKTGMALKIALAVVSILFIISLIANFYFYSRQYGISPDSGLESQVADLQSQVDSLTSDKNNLQSQVTDLQSQLNELQTTYDNYVSTHSYSNEEYNDMVTILTTQGVKMADLENQINVLKAPYLVTRLGMGDERPWFQTPYFHVSGEVWNVGTNTATNCKLHVILYQGSVVAEDTYINLGTISGRTYTSVDSKIYYEGSALTNWNITPEWD